MGKHLLKYEVFYKYREWCKMVIDILRKRFLLIHYMLAKMGGHKNKISLQGGYSDFVISVVVHV